MIDLFICRCFSIVVFSSKRIYWINNKSTKLFRKTWSISLDWCYICWKLFIDFVAGHSKINLFEPTEIEKPIVGNLTGKLSKTYMTSHFQFMKMAYSLNMLCASDLVCSESPKKSKVSICNPQPRPIFSQILGLSQLNNKNNESEKLWKQNSIEIIIGTTFRIVQAKYRIGMELVNNHLHKIWVAQTEDMISFLSLPLLEGRSEIVLASKHFGAFLYSLRYSLIELLSTGIHLIGLLFHGSHLKYAYRNAAETQYTHKFDLIRHITLDRAMWFDGGEWNCVGVGNIACSGYFTTFIF